MKTPCERNSAWFLRHGLDIRAEERMERYKIVYDISVFLGEESIDYPGDTPYSRELIWTIKDSDIRDLSKPVMSAH
jgi:hypothetical protein